LIAFAAAETGLRVEMLRAGTVGHQAQRNASSFKRCRIAIQKGTMTDKSPKTKAELEALVLAELRAAPDCGGAVHVTVVAFDDYRVPATWEVASCNPGTSAPEACERALCDVVSRLQQHFDIAPS
jgi:hypothetical protein